MKRCTFTVILVGEGETLEDCWDDAVSGFLTEPGPCPEEGELEEVTEEEL